MSDFPNRTFAGFFFLNVLGDLGLLQLSVIAGFFWHGVICGMVLLPC